MLPIGKDNIFLGYNDSGIDILPPAQPQCSLAGHCLELDVHAFLMALKGAVPGFIQVKHGGEIRLYIRPEEKLLCNR